MENNALFYDILISLERACIALIKKPFKLNNPPEMTDSFQPSRSKGRPEVLEKHWSSRTFSLFSSASFLGQSDPPPPTQLPPTEDECWFSELQERDSRPSEHHRRGGELCSHPSWTLRGRRREDKWWNNISGVSRKRGTVGFNNTSYFCSKHEYRN